ncbi:DNA-binding protein HEXBP, partial [Termitomyces sp. J132]
GEGHVSRDCTKEAKPKSCYRCGEEGHISQYQADISFEQSRDCPNADNTLPPANAECYRCGKVGHIARNCTEASTGNNMSYGGGFGGNSQKTCYTCGGIGHLSRDCVQGNAKCYNCGGVGHISRDCTRPQKRACYTCGQDG